MRSINVAIEHVGYGAVHCSRPQQTPFEHIPPRNSRQNQDFLASLPCFVAAELMKIEQFRGLVVLYEERTYGPD